MAELLTSLDRMPWDPTPEEIRAECRQIQAGWDQITERTRRVARLHKPQEERPSHRRVRLTEIEMPRDWMP